MCSILGDEKDCGKNKFGFMTKILYFCGGFYDAIFGLKMKKLKKEDLKNERY
jgi:hypothetical protein